MDDTDFYATAAQVIPTLLVVFAVQLHRMVPEPGLSLVRWRRAITFTLVVALLGETSAILSLWNPENERLFQKGMVAFAVFLLLAFVLAMASVTANRLMKEASPPDNEQE